MTQITRTPGVRIAPSERAKLAAAAHPPLQSTPPTAAQIAQAHAGAPPANFPQPAQPAASPANPQLVARQTLQPAPRAPLASKVVAPATGLAASHRSVYSNGKAARAQREARAQRSRPGVGQHAPRSKESRATLGLKR